MGVILQQVLMRLSLCYWRKNERKMNNVVLVLLSIMCLSCNRVLINTEAIMYDSHNNPTSKWILDYDGNGKIKSRLNYIIVDDAFLEDEKITYSCIKDFGFIDSVKTTYKMVDKEWKPVSKVINRYNEQLVKLMTTNYNYDNGIWTEDFCVSWIYDSLFRVSFQVSDTWLNKYEYNDRLVSQSMLILEDREFELQRVSLDSLDNNGNVIKHLTRKKVLGKWEDLVTKYIVYDEKYRVKTEKTITYGDGFERGSKHKTEYEYNQAGQIVKQITSSLNDGKWDVQNITEWVYSRTGELMKSSCFQLYYGKYERGIINEYEFDNMGNRTREVISRTSGDVSTSYLDHVLVYENHYKLLFNYRRKNE